MIEQRDDMGLLTIESVVAKFKDGARIYCTAGPEAVVIEPGEAPILYNRKTGQIRPLPPEKAAFVG